MRLDVFLTKSGLAKSRTDAARLIAAGAVSLDGVPLTKPAFSVEENTPAERFSVDTAPHPFVSRGGLKLEAALDAFSLSPEGKIALDVGASSGGFTDCLLRRGASHVYAVDAGEGQLAPALRADSRVTVRENCNARYLTPRDFPALPDFAVMDVSFISQTLILPVLAALLPTGAVLVSLIKPQFEVGRAGIGKGGIVRDPALCEAAAARVCAFACEVSFSLVGRMNSPITGGDGNHEYLAAFIRS